MAATLVHRGPDDAGAWEDVEGGVGLAHRRLSIVDLSPAGHQPMLSACGRFVIVFNGEIYNHGELRAALDRSGANGGWRGHSDTETLLVACVAWGLEETLRRATGMFAFALWDRAERCLTLARDRLGEKPLYYGWQGDVLLFGSELKALRAHPAWCGTIDRVALARYMRVGYVPAPMTIWQGIRKLLPGTLMVVRADTVPGTLPAPSVYWRALDVASVGAGSDLDDAQAIELLDFHLRQSIGRQMVADVPLGAFLSGGVDSSTVVALMQAQAMRPVRTFSIGFAESDYDESHHARAVAVHLHTDHTELLLSAADALEVIPRLPEIYDEPFGDSSQIPTYLVAALARRHVTVSLSGDGGDELFGGYNRHLWGSGIWRRIGKLPHGVRTVAGVFITAIAPGQWDALGTLLYRGKRFPGLGDKLHKLAAVIDARDADDLYQRLISQQMEKESIVLGAVNAEFWADTEARALPGCEVAEHMMFHDLVGYLCDDILVKVDRAAMAASLETRVPLLDHHVVEFAWRLPLRMKVRDGQGKWLLRQVLYRYVPRELIERPKQGFAIPLNLWLRGSLRDWAEALLDESRLRREGYLRPEPIRRKWQEHLSGRRNWQHWLWNVLMFQSWQERWL
jgi:asparagine synthase (glutamine-hydrolysing)